jgi:proton-translocating NADH-quinone oxidoreductase chain M
MLFYIAFECSLIPMFIIIGIWGSKERKIRASYMFFMYSVIGSFLFLTSLLYIILKLNTMDLLDIQLLSSLHFSFFEELLLWLGCFFSFAVKTPLVPFHLWLPEAHVEAPTSGSVMLAGILLKMGSYGFIRFNYSLFPTASYVFSPYLFLLGILGVLYACSSAFLQFDIKKIIAYSSVAHMSIITLGLFTMNNIGFLASVISMIAHSFVASGLFLCIGILYEKFQTRNIFYYGGIFRIMPLFSVFFFILCFANIAFPGTLSFIGEFLILQSLVKVNLIASCFVFISFIISSAYVLFLLNRILFTNFKMVSIFNTINTSFYDIIPSPYFNSVYSLKMMYSKKSTNSFFYSLFIFTSLTIIFGVYSSPLIQYLEVDLNLITQLIVK